LGENRFGYFYTKRIRNHLILDFSKDSPKFYGRRKGRKLSATAKMALIYGENYLIKSKNQTHYFSELFHSNKNQKIILEIGFGNGDNLVELAKKNPEKLYIGAEPFLNSAVQCIQKLIKYNLENVKIWQDDIKKILDFVPPNIISEIKILFPDPWPKAKHKSRRLIQPEFIECLNIILVQGGTITIGTDHPILKSWILENFQTSRKFEWVANNAKEWRTRPSDCIATKYEKKSYKANRLPSWFVYKKIPIIM